MKIALIARSNLFTARGGDTIQMENLAACFHQSGIKADIRLCHEPIDYTRYDLLHFFNLGRPGDMLRHINRSGKPFVVSPNLVDYSEFDKYHRKGISGTLFSFLSPGAIEYMKTVARWLLGRDKLVSKAYLWKGHYRSVRTILQKAALVLPGSMLEYEHLTRLYHLCPPFELTPNGVDTSLFSWSPQVKKDGNMVLCAARIEGLKNQLNLIRALNNTSCQLVIAGSPAPNQQHYYRKCREIAAGNIHFVDHLPQEALRAYYQEAAVHILPSWLETCGLSSLEAAATGCNVVITSKGYTKEYFEDLAIYCDPASPASIRRAVEKALAENRSAQLRNRVTSLYTWPQAARKTVAAYKNVLSRHKKLRIGILGTRGIPNHYGGFEQFAEHLSAGLSTKNYEVTVYNSHRHPYRQKTWKNVQLVHCYDPEHLIGTPGQFIYDLNCIRDARKRHYDIILMLGYTSSSAWGWLFPKNTRVLFNMDGLEWQRAKYSPLIKRFLCYAEKLAVKYGDYHIADSTVVQQLLKKRYNMRCHYIGYGAELLDNEEESLLGEYQVSKYGYYVLMARMEPENNIETILEGFAASNSTKKFLVIGNTGNKLGKHLVARFKKDQRIQFIGGLFNNPRKLHTIKVFSYAYFHGHSVGGTNPSLLEAMASRALIAAHDNPFNKAILHENAFYFSTAADVTRLIQHIVRGETEKRMIAKNLQRIKQDFTWERIIGQYEAYFLQCLNREPVKQHAVVAPPTPKLIG